VHLIRLQAFHQRHYRYVPLFDYIAGKANAMDDDCTGLWFLSDSQLLTHVASLYPQSQPWTICQLRKPMRCALISALSMNASRPGIYCFWRTLSVSQWYLMSIAFELFYFMVSFKMPNAVKLSVRSSVAGWMWPNSVSVTLSGAPL
jgi:hypothetical protein